MTGPTSFPKPHADPEGVRGSTTGESRGGTGLQGGQRRMSGRDLGQRRVQRCPEQWLRELSRRRAGVPDRIPTARQLQRSATPVRRAVPQAPPTHAAGLADRSATTICPLARRRLRSNVPASSRRSPHRSRPTWHTPWGRSATPQSSPVMWWTLSRRPALLRELAGRRRVPPWAQAGSAASRRVRCRGVPRATRRWSPQAGLRQGGSGRHRWGRCQPRPSGARSRG